MTSDNVTNMAGGIEKYGVGTVAVAIVFAMFIVVVGILVKLVYDNNANHRKEMIPVLKALTDSLDTLSDTQLALKELIIERIGAISKQTDSTHALLENHVKDCSRLETTVNSLQPSILKTEERTKACQEGRRKDT
jgi:type II secretory pathway predicted ATPase ExeA